MRILLMAGGLLLCIGVLSCQLNSRQRVAADSTVQFTPRELSVIADTTVNSVVYRDGSFFCAQDNGRLLVFDTLYHRQPAIESRFNVGRVETLYRRRDSLFLFTGKQVYCITPGLELKTGSVPPPFFDGGLYEDEDYEVSGCCMGEFGGSVYFTDRHTGARYSYRATCAEQVLRFRGEYIVCTTLAHMSGFYGFLHVRDPHRLYKAGTQSNVYDCNWWQSLDPKDKEAMKTPPAGVWEDEGREAQLCLLTFPYRDSLYSILTGGGLTALRVHRDSTTVLRDTLFHHNTDFNRMRFVPAGSRHAALYDYTLSWTGPNGVMGMNASGLVVVNGTQIDFVSIGNGRPQASPPGSTGDPTRTGLSSP